MPYASGRVIHDADAYIMRFEASMQAAGTTEHRKQRFYCDNFVDLMGAGLAPELRAAA